MRNWRKLATLLASAACSSTLFDPCVAAPATLLFEDDFDRGIPGWTAVQPQPRSGGYTDGPMRWQYDIVSDAFVEASNIYTAPAGGSDSAAAVMLINETITPDTFAYRATLTAGDDDAFGLIFGYDDPLNFYRVTFTRQERSNDNFPGSGWRVDRMVDNVDTILFGHGTPDFVPSFVNTQGIPFEVTIEVTSGNRLTLIVVEDPEFFPIEYRLVENQPLPSSAAGQVGLMAWGMSGSSPRGFQISDLQLTPTPLTGDPNALPEWTPVVPPRQGGDDVLSSGHGQPLWSLALGQEGPYGSLHETSDSLGGNDEAGQVDFFAPSIVAGDAQWTDYVYTARLIPGDDDGIGLLLRYQDENNFYRIAFRSQSSGTGVPQGMSIQKVVDNVYEEVARDAQFVPSSGVPFDVYAAISGDVLQVVIISDPDGAAETFVLGPYNISEPNVDQGRIGLFSWAMARSEFDFVRVESASGVPLQVSSPFGDPDPAPGLHSFPSGSTVTATVQSPTEVAPGIRQIATGWTGSGSVPATGEGASVTFDLSQFSFLSWQWRTEYRLDVSGGPGGSVDPGAAGPEWHPEGEPVTVTATPDEGFVFLGWSGDLGTTEPSLSLVMNRPYSLEARFSADTDDDTLPDDWEERFFGNLNATPGGDDDGDGKSNRAEFEDGSDPTFAEQLLVSDPLSSNWENVQRDPVLPGQWVVRDFGDGFRGAWDNSNDFRGADDAARIGADQVVPNVSFQGTRLIIRPEIWEDSWTDYTATAIFSVGDNDGNCLYFRYQDENNWYRVTVVGENNDAGWRAPYGVSVQKREGGVYTELARDPSFASDPSDIEGFKRFRITVVADGAEFEIRTIGWNTLSLPPVWDAVFESVITVSDSSFSAGRAGFGSWGQGGGSATDTNPVDAGVLCEEFTVEVGGQTVFQEDWEQAPLRDEFPDGWTNPLEGQPAAGDWAVSAHGTFVQFSNYGPSTSGTTANPTADADGPVLLGPAPGSANYILELGFHPFDNDGIGFVYDWMDADNYARVIFVSESSAPARIPQGVSVSRKEAGTWTDLILGDSSFVYEPGRPFSIVFSGQNGSYQLSAFNDDDPANRQTLTWLDSPMDAGHRFGFTAWGETDAHFTGAEVFSLPAGGLGGSLEIVGISVSAQAITLNISNSTGDPYDVQSSPDLEQWTTVAEGQTVEQWSGPLPADAPAVQFYRLRRHNLAE